MEKAGPVASIVITAALMGSLAAGLPGCSSNESTNQQQSESQEQQAEQNAAQNSSDATQDQLTFDSIPNDAIVSIDELDAMLKSDNPPTVVDIRSRNDYDFAFIAGSKNIPAGRQLEARADEIPRDGVVVLIGLDNSRVAQARQTLLDAGFDENNVKVADGGIDAWSSLGKHIESRSSRKC